MEKSICYMCKKDIHDGECHSHDIFCSKCGRLFCSNCGRLINLFFRAIVKYCKIRGYSGDLRDKAYIGSVMDYCPCLIYDKWLTIDAELNR